MAYFRKVEAPEALKTLDSWIRRKLRCMIWRHWKNPTTRYAKLLQLGVAPNWAHSAAGGRHGPWWHAGSRTLCEALPNNFLAEQGLDSLFNLHRKRRRKS
jgi:RNA-directed DNA polymerase